MAATQFAWRNDESADWEAGWFDCMNSDRGMGGLNCILCLCFPGIFHACTTKELTGTNCCFAYACYPVWLTRNITRRAFNINSESGACSDVMWSCFCQHCVIGKTGSEVYGRKAQKGFSDAAYGEWFKAERAAKLAAFGRKEGPTTDWAIPLIGKCTSVGTGACLFAFCFPHCSVAQSKKRFDRSDAMLDCCINLCCLNSTVIYNLVRESLDYQGSCVGDILKTVCCEPCIACQLDAEMQRMEDPTGWQNRNPA